MARAGVYRYGYRLVRRLVLQLVYGVQAFLGKPKNLEPAITIGDTLLHQANALAGPTLFKFSRPLDAGAYMYDLFFPSALTFAAFKDDLTQLDIWLKMGLGGGAFKTITSEPRPGNPSPRIQDLGDGLINAMGLPGPGAQKLAQKLNGHAIFRHECPLGASIGGHSPEGYLDAFTTMLTGVPELAYFELNISCPNTPDGQNLMTHFDLLETLVKDCRALTDKPIGVKVSPDQPNQDLQSIAELLTGIPKTFVNAGNTTYRTCEQVGLPKEAISIGGGGLSGNALFPRTLEMVRLFSEFDLPIIGTGGVRRPAHVIALREAGATLVGLATVLVRDLYQIVSMQDA